MSGVAEALADLRVPITSLHPHPQNPRKGDVEAIKRSLEEFGQVRPIVAQPDGTIVAGHHVFYAAQELQWDDIATVFPDLDDEQARRYLIADNRLAELGSYDQSALAGLLEEIMEAGQLRGTGYEPDDITDLLMEMGEVPVNGDGGEELPDDPPLKRDEDDSSGSGAREVVLMLDAEEFESFVEHVRTLKEAYGMEATTATVREAVRREVARYVT